MVQDATANCGSAFDGTVQCKRTGVVLMIKFAEDEKM